MIENVESFRTELYIDSLRRLEHLVYRHVEVGAMRKIQAIPAGVAESESLGFDKGVGIEEQRPFLSGISGRNRERIADNVSERAIRDDTVGHTGAVPVASVFY